MRSAWILWPALVAAASVPGQRPPNVVLIMTDDQGWGDIRSHGNDAIDTPTLDALAASGARFERFFVSPVCAPTRAALLTGRYAPRTGTHGVTRGRETMRASEVTLAEVFRANGYATGCFGKWHNGAHFPQHPNGQGFDTFVGFCAGHWNNYFDTVLEKNGEPLATRGYIADVITNHAITFVDAHRSKPFLCYVPFNTPHSPWQVDDKLFEKYRARELDAKTACAYAMCENIDSNVGRLLRKLDELDLADDTIVLFTTDNGPNSDRYNGGMRGRKGSVHEGGVRVPLFVRWPDKIASGTRVAPIAQHVDLLPTLAAMAGLRSVETPKLDGVNLAPLLIDPGRAASWPDRLLFSFHARGAKPNLRVGAVRDQRWRLVRARRSDGWQLFDMADDPGQKRNVAGEHRELAKRLATAFDDKIRDITARGFTRIPTEVGHPERGVVILPGHEAQLHPEGGGLRYVGRSGWANDWITGWTDADAYPSWNLNFVAAGRYRIALRHSCEAVDAGATIRIEIGDQQLTTRVTEHAAATLPSPDRVQRGEVYERRWGTLDAGTLDLPSGPAQLRVRCTNLVGKHVIELKAIELHRAR